MLEDRKKGGIIGDGEGRAQSQCRHLRGLDGGGMPPDSQDVTCPEQREGRSLPFRRRCCLLPYYREPRSWHRGVVDGADVVDRSTSSCSEKERLLACRRGLLPSFFADSCPAGAASLASPTFDGSAVLLAVVGRGKMQDEAAKAEAKGVWMEARKSTGMHQASRGCGCGRTVPDVQRLQQQLGRPRRPRVTSHRITSASRRASSFECFR